ncbi:hypothetical protein MBLNU13_g11705t2 [Cladosporium sp. NU13]
MSQCGGGLAIVSQLTLYYSDSQGLLQKAIARPMQRAPMFEVKDLADCNAALLISSDMCLRAYLSLVKYKAPDGQLRNVSVIIGTANNEGAEPEAHSNTTLSIANNQVWNLTDAQVQEAAALYLADATFGSARPNSYFQTDFEAYIQSLSQFGENGCHASDRMIGRYMSDASNL